MTEPTLGNPQNTIEILKKYNFTFQKKCAGQDHRGGRDYEG